MKIYFCQVHCLSEINVTQFKRTAIKLILQTVKLRHALILLIYIILNVKFKFSIWKYLFSKRTFFFNVLLICLYLCGFLVLGIYFQYHTLIHILLLSSQNYSVESCIKYLAKVKYTSVHLYFIHHRSSFYISERD